MDFTTRKLMPADIQTHVVEELSYCVDGLNVKGLCLTPKKCVKRLIVYLRGGKGQVGRVRLARLLQFIQPHTLVFAPYYRGNNGSEGRDEFAGEDLNDVEVATRILTSQYPKAYIHFIGFSRGGIQGLLTFQRIPVHSYIIWGGVSDLKLMFEERVDLRDMLKRMIGHPQKAIKAYEARDALKLIEASSPPVLIIHGGKDRQVGIKHAYVLEARLQQKDVTFDTFYQLEEGHVPKPKAMQKVLAYIYSWMETIEENNKSCDT
ncbi:Dipeptidyl aminopeptidase/acylaminoacyl-peptidase [Staphylococcus agnetis]|uniref:alpha/beta hydrolase family protein n=1 Tax=Staphylococcus agnetis TaxID=985762 RepID=UPI000E04739C|nr:prolyl oligopeptidase family serine peptidase [Staphylococcus agnetis]SUK12800.1 Dipeptidyl aminopeptidase/acylaminoacyl-peptidase [Staphylococcus agnetis]